MEGERKRGRESSNGKIVNFQFRVVSRFCFQNEKTEILQGDRSNGSSSPDGRIVKLSLCFVQVDAEGEGERSEELRITRPEG